MEGVVQIMVCPGGRVELKKQNKQTALRPGWPAEAEAEETA